MNIWDWVIKLENDLEEAGHEHASKIIEQLSTEILDLNIDKADALIPEAIALSRSLKNPWLEVFFRHWEMRNRIGNKSEGESALADVVSLFEFSHRDETITCPQTVCVTQDLSACYANIDGPGWVAERIAVCEETLERITPKWNCFHCLSCEYADALLDDGKPAEALEFLKVQEDKILEVGEEISEAMRTYEIYALLRLNKVEEALTIIEKCEADVEGYDWPVNKQERKTLKALILGLLGRTDEAWESLPNWGEMVPRYYLTWIKAADALVTKSPEKNTWQIGSILQEALSHFLKVGNYRRVIEIAEIQVRLALARNSLWTAKRGLKVAYEALPKLRAAKGADLLLEKLSEQIANSPIATTLPVAANELLAWLEKRGQETENRNPEEEIELLLLATEELPNDEQLIEITSSALQACTAPDEAEALLWKYVENNHQQETKIAFFLLNLLIKQGKISDIDRLIQYFEQVPPVSLWCKVQQALAKDDWDTVKELSLKMYELLPDYSGPVYLLVNHAVRQKNFAEACKWQSILVDKAEEPHNELWDLLTFSAANQNWEQARETAKRLEINLESTEGPFAENWGWARIQVTENGENIEYLAHCTGPVTAHIKELARTNKNQRTEDWIVFDAQQLDTPPEDEEERKYFIPLYRMVTTLQQGGFDQSWHIDGAYPGEELFGLFEKSIEELGWKIWVNSNKSYQITDSFDLDEAQIPAIFLSIAAPKNVTPAEIDKALTELTENWEHPVCWLHLAKAANTPLEPHQEVIDRYGL